MSVYQLIKQAVVSGKLNDPFSTKDFRAACPGLGEGTYNAWLYKHREGNPGGYRPYMRRVGRGKFELIR